MTGWVVAGDVSPTLRRAIAMAAVTVAVFLAWAATAQATITQANVTSPADGTRLLDNEVSNPGGTFTVTGTTNSSDPAADTVDIDCYNGGATQAFYDGPTHAGVGLDSQGNFTAQVPLSDLSGNSCELLAVPDGTAPNPGASYTGPRVALSQFSTTTVGGVGPNANDLRDYLFADATLSGSDSSNSVSSCGPFQQLYDGSPAMNASGLLFACAGSLYGTPGFYAPGNDQTRSEIQVDGNNAYSTRDALIVGGQQRGDDPNFPVLSVTLDRFDPSTGAAQTTEHEPLVECSPSDVYNANASQCSTFVHSGVSFTRVTDYSGDGRVATVTDTYASTDGNSHALDLEYEQDLQTGTAGWMLPGESAFSQHATGDTAGPSPAAPGTIYAISDTTAPPSFINPVGALTFATPYNSIRFDNTLFNPEQGALVDYQRSIPAGGSVSIQWSYADGTSLAEVQADADQAQVPSIAISSPSPGAVLPSSPVTVTGAATAGSGVRSVTVNGVAASLTGETFSASIPLSPGTDTIIATLTSVAGTTKSVSESVAYEPPTPTVPPVASSGSASHIQSSTAKLAGQVTAGSAAVSYFFQYGTTATYGHQTKSVSLPAGTKAVAVSANVSGLKAHTAYHYRLVATGAGGTSHGADKTFTTLWALKALVVKVSPHRDVTAPYGFTVSGSLKLPRGVTRHVGCTGTVTVLVKHGTKKLIARVTHVRRDCTYSSGMSFSSAKLKRQGTISFTVIFNGNRRLGARKAKAIKAGYG